MKIPNVCAHYGVTHMTLPQMFVTEGWNFGGSAAASRSTISLTDARERREHPKGACWTMSSQR